MFFLAFCSTHSVVKCVLWESLVWNVTSYMLDPHSEEHSQQVFIDFSGAAEKMGKMVVAFVLVVSPQVYSRRQNKAHKNGNKGIVLLTR